MMKITDIMIIAVTAVAAACSDSDSLNPVPVKSSTPITFSIGQSDSAYSRGTTSTAYNLESFTLGAYVVEGINGSYRYIDHETITRSQSGIWTTDNPYYWPPEGDPVRFVAIANYDDSNLTLINPWVTDPLYHEYYFTDTQDVRNQKDILFAMTEPINYANEPGRSVSLQFYHALARVIIKINGNSADVRTIELRNVWGSGKFIISTRTWLTEGAYGGEAVKQSYTVTLTDDGQLPYDSELFLVPQTTPGDSRIVVTMKDGTVKEKEFAWQTIFSQANNYINITL